MATSIEESSDGDEPEALSSAQLDVWSISANAWRHRTTIAHPVGTMVVRGNHVVALHGHPRLMDPATGTVIAEWPDIAVSVKSDSYGVTHVPTPVVALHPDQQRLAVAQPDHIAVIRLPAR
jgi:hypothetical protein